MIAYGFIKDGAVILGLGDTTAEAVGDLIAVFGDHVEDEVQARVVQAIADLGNAIAGDDAPPLAGGGSSAPAVPPAGGDGGAGGDGVPEAQEAAPEPAGEPDDVTPTGDHQDLVEGAQEGPRCDLCGADVPAGWAEVALEDYGRVQCKRCSG